MAWFGLMAGVAAGVLGAGNASGATTAPTSQASPDKKPLKLKTSEWIAKYMKEGQYAKAIDRIERLLKKGSARKIAAVSNGLKRRTGKDLVLTLIDARIGNAAVSGKLAMPSIHELADYAPRTAAAADRAAKVSESTLRSIRHDLRLAAYKTARGEEQAKCRAEVGKLLKSRKRTLSLALKSATQARAIYATLTKYYGRTPDTAAKAKDMGRRLKFAEQRELELKRLVLEKFDAACLDEVIAAFGRATVEIPKMPAPKKPEPRIVRPRVEDDEGEMDDDGSRRKRRRRGRRRRGEEDMPL